MQTENVPMPSPGWTQLLQKICYTFLAPKNEYFYPWKPKGTCDFSKKAQKRHVTDGAVHSLGTNFNYSIFLLKLGQHTFNQITLQLKSSDLGFRVSFKKQFLWAHSLT